MRYSLHIQGIKGVYGASILAVIPKLPFGDTVLGYLKKFRTADIYRNIAGILNFSVATDLYIVLKSVVDFTEKDFFIL